MKEKNKLNSDEIEEISQFIAKVIMSIILGIGGYFFCKYVKIDVLLGIIVGIFLPWGYEEANKIGKSLEDLYNLLCLCTLGLFYIIGIIIKIFASAVIGVVMLPTDIFKILWMFIKRNKKEETKIENNKEVREKESINGEVKEEYKENDKFYCERCFKKITEEEYELNDGVCEDCLLELNIDDEENYKEDF